MVDSEAKMRMRRHARKRARERFNVSLTRNVRADLKNQILCGRAVFLGSAGRLGRHRWLAILGGQAVQIVVDELASGEIVTVMNAGQHEFKAMKQMGRR